MGRRNVYGNDWSENGWPMVDQASCQWITVPGTNVRLEIQTGWPLAILRAFAADYHAYIEPLRDADSACWTRENSVGNSNHLSGTGMDLNWNGEDGKTFRYNISEARAYPGDKARRVRELLDFYEGFVFCGGFWSNRDWMHFQMGGNTYGQARTQAFIDRKIRADGFSTFRRGNAPVNVAADVLARATGLNLARATEILPAVMAGLVASDCTNPNRIAMWLAQVGHESASFQYTEEIAKNGRYAPYIGRTWIQITWDYNYRAFSKWCFDRGLVPTPDYFVPNYRELADLKWAGLGAAWYWTVARTDINALSDRQDLITVTQRINGGQNGIEDRRNRYNRARALGDQLLELITPQEELDEWDALMADPKRYASRSMYRSDDVENLSAIDLLRNIDAMKYDEKIEEDAYKGDPAAIAIVAQLAQGKGPCGKFPDAVARAQFVIRRLQSLLATQNGPNK
ncbi:endolysin [Mycobacterium phage MyraDee]|uniref:Lysin A n=1 Tax=Mycobacterium phage MyraDee TaxID=2024303 RepID=A0A222Z0N7_9CAUD|nr:endolysin [Mycobacterium phage MyraDee]ASR77115.1 lysin A [Mycobacterium phage MyraDee]